VHSFSSPPLHRTLPSLPLAGLLYLLFICSSGQRRLPHPPFLFSSSSNCLLWPYPPPVPPNRPPPLQPVAMNLPKPPNSNSIFGRRRSLLRHHPSFFPVTPPIRFGIQIRDSDSICLQTACKLVEEGESLPLWARPPPVTRQSQIKACIRVDFSCLFVFLKLG
jgi:hypothetical protein